MKLDEAWWLVKLTSQKGDSGEIDAYKAREIVQEAIEKYKHILVAYERLMSKQKGGTKPIIHDEKLLRQ